MVNQLVLLINVIGVLLIDAFLAPAINISHNLPPTMAPGSEVKVVMTVEKGDLSGFAKLQIDLPQGLSATAIETKGASFTFADGKAKFIWMSLPPTPSFKVSYTLAADRTASGVKQVTGRLSYIENNERKTFELAPSTVDLGSPLPLADVSAAPESTNSNDLVSAAGGAPAGTVAVSVVEDAIGVAPMQGAGGVQGKRTITPVTEKEMLVEVVVDKGSIRGFGKLQETIPQGFTATEKSSDEAIFTAQDRIVKFVWLNLPSRNEVKVTYKLRANERPDGEYSIDGEFGYLLNDETQKAVLGTSKFFVGARALELLAAEQAHLKELEARAALALRAKEQASERPSNGDSSTEQARQAKPAKERNAVTAEQSHPKPKGIPAPEKGVTYKVQITAAHREVGKAYFKARHRFDGDFQLERHQGWIKYVTGSFAAYKDARDQRVAFVQAGHEFPGPFVTAYNNGERITVQEALVISRQQWMQ